MNETPKPYDIITLVAGGVMLIFSFLAWYTGGGDSISAWSAGLLPLATFVPLMGVISAVVVGISNFANVDMPDEIFGFSMNQILFVLADVAALIALGYLIIDKDFGTGFGGISLGIGFWFNLLGAIALIVAAVMRMQDDGVMGSSPGGMAPPQQF